MSGEDRSNSGATNEEKEIEEALSKVDDTTFNEGDDWNIVVMETRTLAAEWNQLAIYLGLSFDLINGTIKLAGDSFQCWSEALRQWILHNYNTKTFGEPSWRTLLKAVAQVNKLQFKKLAASHQVESRVSTTSGDQKATVNKDDVVDVGQPAAVAVKVEAASEVSVFSSTNSSVLSAKAKITFHRLNLEDLSDEEKRHLYQKLFAESEDISYKFQDLFSSTTDSLRLREVPVKELCRHLECLGHLKPTFEDSGEPVFRKNLRELKKMDSVDDAMSVINNYCSFFNYRMLEHIINKLGVEKDKVNLARYKEDFARYGERHVFECPAVVGQMSEEGQANMFLKLDESFDNCSLNHLYAFVDKLENLLKMTDTALRLCRIEPGCLELIFQLPLSVQRSTFPLSSDQEVALAGLGVIHLSCGDYQLTRQENKEVEGPASDGDSGHTDSEGSVGSMDTMSRDAELSSLFAGLAVGKPLDSFSLMTDSALGRSTLATSVTTAGVTQFSEDLLDRELDDLDMGMGHGGTGISKKLHRASRRGDLEKVKRLTEEKGFNPLKKVGKYERNALHYAARGGHVGVMRYFIEERGCNPASQDSRGGTSLHHAAYYNHLELVQYLVDVQKMDPMCQAKRGSTPLHKACHGGNIDVVTYLINTMIKYLPLEDVVRYKGKDGHTPVHYAAAFGHLKLVKYFITKLNFDPHITNNHCRTILHDAAQEGHLDIVKFLIEEQTCNPAPTDKDKATPLYMAAGKGRLETVKYFTLEQRCDPLCTNKRKNTPLHSAAKHGQLEVVKFFTETLHCPTDVRGQRNKTPLEQARRYGHHHVVEYLKSITK